MIKAYKLLRDIIDGVTPGLFKVGKPDEAWKLYKQLRIMGHCPMK